MTFRRILSTAVLVGIGAATAASAQGYYASKADERAGRLTPGRAPQGAGPFVNAGSDVCPGAVIANPGAGNFADSDTTVGKNNTVNQVQAGCSNYQANAGPDVVYQYDLGPLGARGTPLTIVVTPTTATYDPSIYNLSTAGAGCPAGTAVNVTNCVNGADATLANQSETITDVETDAMAAGHYFLFVDSFYGAAATCPQSGLLCGSGAYNLTFGTGPFPVELIDFSVQ